MNDVTRNKEGEDTYKAGTNVKVDKSAGLQLTTILQVKPLVTSFHVTDHNYMQVTDLLLPVEKVLQYKAIVYQSIKAPPPNYNLCKKILNEIEILKICTKTNLLDYGFNLNNKHS